jgi:hypothetical protein
MQRNDMPRISVLLLQEAEVWRSVMNLHTSVIHNTTETVRLPGGNVEESDMASSSRSRSAENLRMDEMSMQSDARVSTLPAFRAFNSMSNTFVSTLYVPVLWHRYHLMVSRRLRTTRRSQAL